MDIETVPRFSRRLRQNHNFKVTLSVKVIHGVELLGFVGTHRIARDDMVFGRHGDIESENILWFEKNTGCRDEDGVLAIADFGLGRFHSRDSRSRANPDTIIGSPTYEPPECRLRLPVSSAYDIWSLVCLYLAFLTWLPEGSNAVDEFADVRGHFDKVRRMNIDTYFEILQPLERVEDGRCRARLNLGVTEWLKRLQNHPSCSEIIRDRLSLIRDHLLVIDSERRISSRNLVKKLDHMLE